MTRKAISIYMTATCAMAIVIPGRFAIGIIIATEVFLLTVFGTLFSALLKTLRITELRTAAMCAFLVSFTVLFKQLLILSMPETALQLSFVLYLPSISSFTTVFLIKEKLPPLKTDLLGNFAPPFIFTVYMLVFVLIRDCIGYGTITLPAPGKMIEIVVFPEWYSAAGTFFATIPGALVLSALFLSLFLAMEEKFKIIVKAGIDK